MKNLTSHFVIYLSTILILIVGATNYLLYYQKTQLLNNSLDSTAQSMLESLTSLSIYYINHYEFELLEQLVANTAAREAVIHISVKTNDDDINIVSGELENNNGTKFTKSLIHNDKQFGLVEIAIDNTNLKKDLQDALISSILLTLATITLIGALLYFFFLNKVIAPIKLAHTEKEFFSIVMDSSSSLVIVFELNGQIILANNSCKHYLSGDNIDIEGKSLWDFFSITCNGSPLQNFIKNKASPESNISRLKNTECFSSCEVNNEKAIIKWSFNILQHNRTRRLIATGVDETMQHMENERLSYLATHDPLTGLANRALFNDRLENAIAYYNRNHDPFCLLYLDLDNFKPINDNMGHEAGDFILQNVASIMEKNLRSIDTFARLGGDEFGIILTNITDRNDAAKIAQKLIDAISLPLIYSEQELHLGVSIGIAYNTDHEHNMEDLINYADIAMYHSKKSGGNTFKYYTPPE